jgi:hypothetical protein
VRSVKEEHNVTQCSQNLKIALQIISNITDKVPKKEKEQTLMLFRLGKMGRKREGKGRKDLGNEGNLFSSCMPGQQREERTRIQFSSSFC